MLPQEWRGKTELELLVSMMSQPCRNMPRIVTESL
jgi:hypothetical protein